MHGWLAKRLQHDSCGVFTLGQCRVLTSTCPLCKIPFLCVDVEVEVEVSSSAGSRSALPNLIRY